MQRIRFFSFHQDPFLKIIYNNKYKLREYFDEIDTNYSYNIREIKFKNN